MRLAETGPVDSQPLRLERVADPVPTRGEVLLRVRACGVCRTDLHLVEGDLELPCCPVIPGHQIVGTVESSGAGVTGLEPGERVGVTWLSAACGSCARCRHGRENLCEQARFTGYHRDGGFAELVTVPAAASHRLPDRYDDAEAAPLLCAGVIGYREHLYWERSVRSVANLTHEDARDFLSLCSEVKLKSFVESFPLEAANEVLCRLRDSELQAAAVLVPTLA